MEGKTQPSLAERSQASPWSLRKASPPHESSPCVSQPVGNTARETGPVPSSQWGWTGCAHTRRQEGVNPCDRPRGSRGEASVLVPPSTGKRRWRLRCLSQECFVCAVRRRHEFSGCKVRGTISHVPLCVIIRSAPADSASPVWGQRAERRLERLAFILDAVAP